jgi:hypothetical protein
MVTGHVRVLNRHLRRYDSDLYADQSMDGKINVYRKYKTYTAYQVEGKNLYVSTVLPQWVMSLTKDWSLNSYPVLWGIEPILNKLKSMDGWRDDGALDEVWRHNERVKANKEREQRNNIRAMAADVRRDFAKATNEINTSTMSKKSRRKY